MDDLRRICSQHRVFLRGEALEAGYDDQVLARGVRHGQLHRVRHGAYVFTEQWNPANDHERHLISTAAVLRQAKTELALSHTTAAVAHGLDLWDLPLDAVHVTRTDRRCGRRQAGVCQHRSALDPTDIVLVHGVPVTSPARTLFDLSTLVDVEHALPIADQVLRRRLATHDDLREICQRMDQTPGSLRSRLVASLANELAESIGESRTRFMMWRGGLPAPVLQHPVLDDSGRAFARVDFAWPDLGVFIEFDGMVKYQRPFREGDTASQVVVRERDREIRICTTTGWRCLRLTWADLYTPEITCRRVRDFLFASAAA